ncbi:MAG: hypothetical protein ABII12_14980 [Planctomycetota bacterium]
MAKEKEEKKKKEEAQAAQPAEGKGKKSIATFGIFGGVMLVEALAIFFAMKFLGSSPDPTLGMEGVAATQPAEPWTESDELEVCRLRVQNAGSGHRTTLYNVTVVIRVHKSNAEKAQHFLESRKNTIEDALGRIVRGAEESQLAEYGLETLKRQFRFELNELIGDDTTIEQVLIPECMPLHTGF